MYIVLYQKTKDVNKRHSYKKTFILAALKVFPYHICLYHYQIIFIANNSITFPIAWKSAELPHRDCQCWSDILERLVIHSGLTNISSSCSSKFCWQILSIISVVFFLYPYVVLPHYHHTMDTGIWKFTILSYLIISVMSAAPFFFLCIAQLSTLLMVVHNFYQWSVFLT